MFEDPDFTTEIAKQFKARIVKDVTLVIRTLWDLFEKLSVLDDNFNNTEVHNVWAAYLENQKARGNKINNEDVYFLLRYVVAGNHVGGPVNEIWEIIGKAATLKRIKCMIEMLRK